MVRSALTTKPSVQLSVGPVAGATLIPVASVLAGSALATLPIVSSTGWWPDAGFLMLIAWRLLRADAWPIWWAAPMGLANDLITGAPIGLSISLWTAVMLAMELIDQRSQWRDYWIEWGIACALIIASCWAQWAVAGLIGAPVAIVRILPAMAIGIFAFPIAAMIVSRLERWRWGQR